MLLVFVTAVFACVLVASVVVVSANQTSQSPGPTQPNSPTGGPQTPNIPFRQLAFGSLATSGRLPEVVTKDGKQAYEVLMRKGLIHDSTAFMYMRPPQFFPSDTCRVRFRLKFDDRFEWSGSATRNVSGKIAGFMIGNGPASGGKFSTTGASYRLTFYRDRGAKAYLYPQLRQNFEGGSPPWSLLNQSPELVEQSYVSSGVHVFAPNRRPQLSFQMGVWNDVQMLCKLNSPGKFDGVMELSINGESRRLTTVRYRDTPIKITSFLVAPFFGGSTQNYAPGTDINMWFADFGFALQ